MSKTTWIPVKNQELIIGPARWSSSGVISDIGTISSQRIIQIGILERLILDKVDGNHSSLDIQQSLSADGVQISTERVVGILNKFAFFGIIERPFTESQSTRKIDSLLEETPKSRQNQIVDQTSRSILGIWKHMSWLAHPFFMSTLIIGGVIAFVSLVMLIPKALTILHASIWQHILLSIIIILFIWSIITIFFHENSHAALFHHYIKREPRLALSRIGIFFVPNTQMPGLSLMPRSQKVATLLAGPLTSALLSAIPIIVLLVCHNPIIETIAAMGIIFDTITIGLCLSLFPNTDMTKTVETIADVDRLHRVSYLVYSRKQHLSLPKSLPAKTRIIVHLTPILVLLTIVIWIAAILGSIWFTLSL